MLPTKGITIWVYDDKGVSEMSVRSALNSFVTKLPSIYISDICRISSQQILNGQLKGKGCFIVPGGADIPYCEKLNGRGNEIIKQFVAQGNVYIGICAGGYYGARRIAFRGEGYQICGKRELAFFPGKATGSITSITNGLLYDKSTASKAIVQLYFNATQTDELYYHGGAYFIGDNKASYNVIARYPNGTNAVVSGDYGQGKYLLSGVHFELCKDIYAACNAQTLKSCSSYKDIEKQLLALISRPHYGQSIFIAIGAMIQHTF